MFEKIKKYYDKGIYKDFHIVIFLQKGIITEEEYKEIMGKDYEK